MVSVVYGNNGDGYIAKKRVEWWMEIMVMVILQKRGLSGWK